MWTGGPGAPAVGRRRDEPPRALLLGERGLGGRHAEDGGIMQNEWGSRKC